MVPQISNTATSTTKYLASKVQLLSALGVMKICWRDPSAINRLSTNSRNRTMAGREMASSQARVRGVVRPAIQRYASKPEVQTTGSAWARQARARMGAAAARRQGFHSQARARAQKHNPRLR